MSWNFKTVFFVILTAIFCVSQSAFSGLIKSKKEVSLKQELSVSQIISKGMFLILTDDTVWKIRPEDAKIASGWIIPGTIQVQKSDNQEYPFRILNETTNTSVLAKRSSQDEIEFFEQKSKLRESLSPENEAAAPTENSVKPAVKTPASPASK